MKIVAHRGNVPEEEEHTQAAFEKALALPIHGVEFDLRLSKDLRLMVHHDITVNRRSDGAGRVSAMTSQELRQLNIGTEDKPQRMLFFDEVLDLAQDHPDKHLYVEIKHPTRFARMTEEQVVRVLRYRDMLDDPRIHILSYAHVSIRRMHRLAPELDRTYLRFVWEPRWNPRDVLFSQPTALGVGVKTAQIRPELVGAHGLPTYMWTANTTDEVLLAEQLGVDILATDDPELALAVLNRTAPL